VQPQRESQLNDSGGHANRGQLRQRHQAARHRPVRPESGVVFAILELVGNAQLQVAAYSGLLPGQPLTELKIRELRAHGDAILLVSHSLPAIRALCHRVAWLDHGRVLAVGAPDDIVEQYRRASNS